MSRVLAITFDGLLQPLGYSQVARVVMGLSARGLTYTILSLERRAQLRDVEHYEHVRGALAASGVDWVALPYEETGGGRAVAQNVARAVAAAHRIASTRDVRLVHARAIHAAMVGRALRASRGIPYVFDVRGYWVDEVRDEGRRFQCATSYAVAKGVERRLYRDADALVTLTELQAQDLRSGVMGTWRDRPLVCIPTCADYDEFTIAEPGAARPRFLSDLPTDARTLGIVGSMNRSYLLDETLALARTVMEVDQRWHLIVLTAQRSEYSEAIRDAGINAARVRIASVPHHEMRHVVPHLDWGLLLLRDSFAKRGSVPTKLAEFFASGVRVAQLGCNREVSDWVERASAGTVLRTFDETTCSETARTIVASGRDPGAARRARVATERHFSLASGIERYAEVIGGLLRMRADQRK